MDIPIIYEDNHILVVEKPVNMLVQRDKTNDKSLLDILKEDIKVRYQKPGNVYLALIHRLDRPVGGVMVFGKTSKAASRLSDTVRRRKMEREYVAVVRGNVHKQEGTLIHYLRKDRKRNIVDVVHEKHPDGKKASLSYKVMEKAAGLSKLAVHLHTGRAHQIRVQLNAMGHPIYGDQKYGYKINKPGQQIALWAHVLGFEHPVKKEWMTFTADLPSGYPWG